MTFAPALQIKQLQRLVSRFTQRHPLPSFGIGSGYLKPKKGSKIGMITLSVDGNIASGKSTLVSKLVELLPKNDVLSRIFELESTTIEPKLGISLEVEVIPEPLEKWCNLKGHNLLEMFYRDPRKYNFLFEHYVQLTRLMDVVESDRPVVGSSCTMDIRPMQSNICFRVMERSLQNNRYCFMELARKNGTLHPVEFSVLSEWYKWLENHVDFNLDLIIYLKTDPKIVYERMKARARTSEELPNENNTKIFRKFFVKQYLIDLHDAYEEWLIGKHQQSSDVIVLDANQSKEKIVSECFLKLEEFIQSLVKSRGV